MEDVVIRGVSIDRKQAKITVSGVPEIPGSASRIFSAVSAANISVDMIVQNASDQNSTDISFTIHNTDLCHAEKLLAGVVEDLGAKRLTAQNGVAKLSVVGIGMRIAFRGGDSFVRLPWSRKYQYSANLDLGN